MNFSGHQVILILHMIADLVEDNVRIPLISKTISSKCRKLAETVDKKDKFTMRAKTSDESLFSAKDWEVIKTNGEVENAEENPE